MILEKHFKFDETYGLQCKNYDDVTAYISSKINEFQHYETYSSKQKRIALLQEIFDMYNEDIQNPDVDLSGIQHILYFDKVNLTQMIQYYDFIWILGSIIYYVFDYDKNAINHVEGGVNGPINMGMMFVDGYKCLVAQKEAYTTTKKEHPTFGATLIFVTFIESELKKKCKSLFISDKLNLVDNLIAHGAFTPDGNQIELMKCLRDAPDARPHNNVYVTTQGARDLFLAAGVTLTKDEDDLVMNSITLNKLLNCNFFQTKAEPAFVQVMRMLLGTGNLNLRNDLAHGNYGYKNYFHSTATSVLFYIAMLIISDDYLL